MKVTGLQLDIVWEDKETNREKVRGLLGGSAGSGWGDLVVLPEMFSTGFSMAAEVIAEPEGGPTEQWLSGLARHQGVAVIGGNVRDAGAGKRFNEALAYLACGRQACRYQKIHPFSLGEEDRHYTPGEEVRVFPLGDAVVAPFVCYDLRFPEVFRAASSLGANLMVVIANWPSKRIQHWVTLLQARAIENQAFVVGVNRTGDDPGIAYCGRNMIVDYMGEVLADAGSDEGAISADLDFAELGRWREGFPALRDRRL